MISFLKWIFTLALVGAAVLFAIAHRQDISVVYSPFQEPVTLPLYALGLGLWAIGFIIGTFSAWIGMDSVRKDRKNAKKSLKSMEKELSEAKKSIITLEQTRPIPGLPTGQAENSPPTTPVAL
jgi:hypothetical protein